MPMDDQGMMDEGDDGHMDGDHDESSEVAAGARVAGHREAGMEGTLVVE